MRMVLDTNVFVSGIHWAGSSEKVLRAWMNEDFELVSSLPIIEELIRILLSFKIPLDPEDISWWESLILEKSILVIPTEKVDVVKDPEDNKFIEAALEGKVDYIVSQDKHLLVLKEYNDIKIVNPDEFLKLLGCFK